MYICNTYFCCIFVAYFKAMETIVKKSANKKGLTVSIKRAREIVEKGDRKRTLRNNIRFILKEKTIILF